ncbi:MAG: CRISPR-associated endonuclease Cas1, partial [Coleofasciculus sp. C2-GNP5-27]
MRTLYVSQQGCYVSLHREMLQVKQGDTVHAQVQLPLTEQILVFGKSQVTTQAIRACLWRNIPIAYLSRMGYCYGRLMSIERGYRQLAHYQQQLVLGERLKTARAIVVAKLRNCRILLRRQRRRNGSDKLEKVLQCLDYLAIQASEADSIERLMGFEGANRCRFFILGWRQDKEDKEGKKTRGENRTEFGSVKLTSKSRNALFFV